MTNKHEWTADWPTHTGWFWFWGWTWHAADMKKHEKPELYAVHAFIDEAGQSTLIADGQFLYKEEGAEGMFCQMVLPPMMPKLPGEGQ